MLSIKPAFLGAMLTIEQTAPTVAEALAHPEPRVSRLPESALPARPPRQPRNANRIYSAVQCLKRVKVRPIIVQVQRKPITPDPSPDEIDAVCRDIRSEWTDHMRESRQLSFNADMRRVAKFWRAICDEQGQRGWAIILPADQRGEAEGC